MTLTDQDGNEHCFEKDSEEEVDVKCVEDDDTTTSKDGKYIICFQKHVSKQDQTSDRCDLRPKIPKTKAAKATMVAKASNVQILIMRAQLPEFRQTN